MERRYCYVGENCIKTFTSYKKMLAFAQDESHKGNFYISTPQMTILKTRDQLLGKGK